MPKTTCPCDVCRNPRARVNQADVLDIRNGLQGLIEKAPAGGVFHDADTEALYRNEFTLRLDPEGPIYTVRVSVGGAMRSRS